MKTNDEILKQLKPIALSLCAMGYFAHGMVLLEETKDQIEAKLEKFEYIYEKDLNELVALFQQALEAKDREREEAKKTALNDLLDFYRANMSKNYQMIFEEGLIAFIMKYLESLKQKESYDNK